MNDITQILEVTSKAANSKSSINQADLQRLGDIDDGEILHPEEYSTADDTFLIGGEEDFLLNEHSKAYIASSVEAGVIKSIKNKKSKGCLLCVNISSENEITTDEFIDFLSQKQAILEPCKSTVDLISMVDVIVKNCSSVEASFQSALHHILAKIDLNPLYPSSQFEEDHIHKYDFVNLIIEVYLDIKSLQWSKFMTRMSQDKLKRHACLKGIHRLGQ